ncbi:MAG: hypothetical protein SV765_12770 [Pseudomonadota bacterium]|nr:hypothetical protein [Pseudomonadales bacterium]MDY6921070.1 hypothetical protein [Pseudomonadota bacterium]|tara:strand:+ start:78 stop:398 length:321 start_codon:yes stop_codon:yes gene_type:complete
MGLLNKAELIKDMIQTAIDNGARTVEEVHKSIADMPFEALERSGLLKDETSQLREKNQQTIGMVYEKIRDINEKVGELASDMFESLEDSQHISRVMDENDDRDQRP